MADHEPKAYAPGLPDIHDDAGDTPMWVPMLGLFLLVAIPLSVMLMSEFGADEAKADEAAVVEQADPVAVE